MNKNLIIKPAVYWITAFYVLLTFSTLGLGEKVAAFAFPEDHYFENVGAISLFVASIIFFYTFFLSRKTQLSGRIFWVKQLVYLGLALLFLFGGGEEISWGQRIFNLKTPDALNEINAQGEITVHNISIMGHKLPFESEFDVLWLTMAVLIPLGSMFVKPFERFIGKFLPVVHWWIGLLFLFDYGLAKIAKIIFRTAYTYSRVPFVQAVQEVKESNYELLFVLFAVFILLDLKRFENDSS